MRYTSPVRVLGLPLVDVRVADGSGSRGVARGWIAIGDIAFGYLFAAGGVAVGAIAFGGLAAGILPFGGLALGVLAIGGGSIGIWAVGGGALALQGAIGGLAVAGQFAVGGLALAPHANDAAARLYFSAMPFPIIEAALRHSRWLLVLAFLPLLLNLWRRKQPEQ